MDGQTNINASLYTEILIYMHQIIVSVKAAFCLVLIFKSNLIRCKKGGGGYKPIENHANVV